MLSSARMPITVMSQAGVDAERRQRGQRDEPGHDAGRAVEIAAMRHRVRDASRSTTRFAARSRPGRVM